LLLAQRWAEVRDRAACARILVRELLVDSGFVQDSTLFDYKNVPSWGGFVGLCTFLERPWLLIRYIVSWKQVHQYALGD
jgi:hypothetical protein